MRSITPPLVWDGVRTSVSRVTAKSTEPSRLRPGLNGLDTLLEAHLNTERPGFYVELGANDGIRQSNTYFLEKEYGWRGLLVEPSLNNYIQLLRNRDARNSFACAACVPFDYAEPFVRMTYANLMTVSRDLSTDLPDLDSHVSDGARFLKSTAEAVDFGAVARTLDALLDSAQAPSQIDLLSLDVEGAEIPVLMGVDHARFRFRRMVIECRSPQALDDFLRPLGYRLESTLSDHDYLYRDVQSEI